MQERCVIGNSAHFIQAMDSQLEDYEEVPYAIWCNYLPELVPPTEVDRLNQKIKNLDLESIKCMKIIDLMINFSHYLTTIPLY